MSRKLTIERRDGRSFDMDALPCDFCGGNGTMRETKRLGYVSIIDGEEAEAVERTAIVGEPCPACCGRGLVGVVGRKAGNRGRSH